VKKIRHMKGFRNILVHGYESLNDTLVYNNIFYGRADIYQFMEEVEDCIKKFKLTDTGFLVSLFQT